MKKTKRILVVEGGAMRGIFATGVLDAFMEENFYDFDLCIGVSAGSTALASYLAGMHGRNYRVTVEYSTTKEFLNPVRHLKGGHFMDLDWLWNYCEENDPIDTDAIMERRLNLLVGVTLIDTGKIEYIELNKDNVINLLKASCAMPIVYRTPVNVNTKLYIDGGISDPIPINEAIKYNPEEIVVIRSRKKDFRMSPKNSPIRNYMLRKYPKVREAVNLRYEQYNKSIDAIRNENSDIRIIEVNPPEIFETTRFTKDKDILTKDYKLGIVAGKDLIRTLI